MSSPTAGVKTHLEHLVTWFHAVENPRARVIIVHGVGEHSGRHLNTVRNLNAQGIEVTRFDLRGCGESGGERQYVESFDDYVSDLTRVFHSVCQKGSSLPLFVLAHSMGGAIGIRFASRYSGELSGLILSAPAYLIGDAFSPLKIAMGKMIARVLPSMRFHRAADMSTISRDPDVIKAYGDDPLACHFNTAAQGTAVLGALKNTLSAVVEIRCPTVLFHGTHDRIVKPEGSFEILRHLKSTADREMMLLPGVYHEPHNDYDKEKYFALLNRWIAQRC